MAFQYEKQAPRQGARTAEEQSAAEVKAERRRAFQQAAELAQRRRERVASAQAGRLPRLELVESELILLESYERKEEAEQRPGFFERLSRRIAGSARGTLVASVITAASAAPTSCGGAYNPLLQDVHGRYGYADLMTFSNLVVFGVGIVRSFFSPPS